ncbi:hypothetical protein RUND412_000588 [Rhizina undulata]
MGAYLVIILSTYAHAATLANSNVAAAPLWVPTPQGRGTVDILCSCLFTITICVWTALHLNIDTRPSYRRKLLKTLKYVALGIFGPEFVLDRAIEQWLMARYLHLSVKHHRFGKLGDFSPRISELLFSKIPAEECRGLTEEVTFYAIMGGFVVESKSNSCDSDSDSPEPTTLTPASFFSLLTNSLLSDVTLGRLHKEVIGLSKADILAKAMVCIQASWFVVQCIARKATGLPVTLIELHTATHVMCALMVFLFWLRKPQNVENPIVIDQYIDKSVLERKQAQEPVMKTASYVETFPPDNSEAETSPLTSGDVRNEEQYDDAQIRYSESLVLQNQLWNQFKTGLDLVFRVENDGEYLDALKGKSRYLNDLQIAFLGVFWVVYGAVHLAAWNEYFPTLIEQWMWRASSLLIIVSCPCILAIHWFDDNCLASFGVVVFSVLCGAARLFLLVEAFISFRSLPLSVYETVSWSNYWPHF